MSEHPLQTVLREQGRNQRWLARQIGISEFQLSRMLHGHIATPEAVQQACASALGVPVRMLFSCAQSVPNGTEHDPLGASHVA